MCRVEEVMGRKTKPTWVTIGAMFAFLFATLLTTFAFEADASAQAKLVKRTKKQIGHRRVYKSKKKRVVRRTDGDSGSRKSKSSSSKSDDDDDGWDIAGEILGAVLEGIFSGDDYESDSDSDSDANAHYVFDFEKGDDYVEPDIHSIFYGGLGVSMRSLEGEQAAQFPAMTYELGYTLDMYAAALDIATSFDLADQLGAQDFQMMDVSLGVRFMPMPSWEIRPTVGLGASWFQTIGDMPDQSGLGLFLTAGALANIGAFDFGFHYKMEVQSVPVYDAVLEESQLEPVGLRNVFMLRTGVRF